MWSHVGGSRGEELPARRTKEKAGERVIILPAVCELIGEKKKKARKHIG